MENDKGNCYRITKKEYDKIKVKVNNDYYLFFNNEDIKTLVF